MNVQIAAALACRAGGADVYTEQLALGLADRGHSVTVICHGASQQVRERCLTLVADLPDHDSLPVAWRIAPWLRKRFWARFIARANTPRPDVIVCSKAVCMRPLARRHPGVPRVYLPHSRVEPVEVASILGEHASRLQRWVACGISHRAEHWCLVNSSATVRFTQGAANAMRDYYKLPDRVRFEVIPPGIVAASQQRPARAAGPLRLVSVGRLVESKNLAFLLDCLAASKCQNWQLDVVGDGPERRQLEQRAQDLKIAEWVRFHGHQDDTDRFYRLADLHLFPSRLESYGLVILEAMAHAVPTLAISANGVRYQNANDEIIRPGVDGLLAGSEPEFRRLLDDCIERQIDLETLGNEARRTFDSHHQWSVVLDRWETLLADLAGLPRTLVARRESTLAAP